MTNPVLVSRRFLSVGCLLLLVLVSMALNQPALARSAQATATASSTVAPTKLAITSTSTLAPSKTPTATDEIIGAATATTTTAATQATEGSSRTAITIRQWASDASATSQYSDPSWNASQATGEPDTDTCGDSITAWASRSGTGVESLTLYFDHAVTPTQINIYQTYNPGAITSVELLPVDGSAAIELADSADPGTDCPGVFTLDLNLDDIKPINGIKIHLDESLTGSWNEIDAVELVGTTRDNVAIEPSSTPAPTATPDPKALRQWASDASASSQYGDSSWSAAQATGKPDTDTCGDNGTAWASSSSSGKDSLTLNYDKPVFPTQINIYQTYNPGAIISIELLPADGSRAIKVPNSADPGTDCPGVFSISITLDDIKPINGVRINLDQTITNGWNEIDAVELVGRPSR